MLADGLSVTLRALSFIALFQAAGIALFSAFFAHQLTTTRATLRRIGTRSAVVAAILVAGHYVLEAARMSGDLAGVMDPALQGLVLHSSTSAASILRLLGLLLIAIGFRMAGLIGAMLALAAFTLVGHTTDYSYRWLLSGLLFLHLFVVAFWFGALAPLFVVSAREPPAVAGRIVERFSSLAIWLVPGLLVAGVVLAALLLSDLAALGTPYGRLLMVKVFGFAVLLGLGALNKWRLGPAIARNGARASRAFRRSLVAEYALIGGVLSVTAILTTFYSPVE